MNVLPVLIIAACAAVSLLTTLALLKDSQDSIKRIIRAFVVFRDQWRAYRVAGVAGIDRDALANAVRPVLGMAVMLLILGASGAVLLTSFNPSNRPSLWMSLLVLGLTFRLAMSVPCSWVRYVFVGDRKPPGEPERYVGPERRRHAD